MRLYTFGSDPDTIKETARRVVSDFLESWFPPIRPGETLIHYVAFCQEQNAEDAGDEANVDLTISVEVSHIYGVCGTLEWFGRCTPGRMVRISWTDTRVNIEVDLGYGDTRDPEESTFLGDLVRSIEWTTVETIEDDEEE